MSQPQPSSATTTHQPAAYRQADSHRPSGSSWASDVGVVYISKGVELLINEFDGGNGTGGWLSVVIAILFALCVYYVERVGTKGFGRELLVAKTATTLVY